MTQIISEFKITFQINIIIYYIRYINYTYVFNTFFKVNNYNNTYFGTLDSTGQYFKV